MRKTCMLLATAASLVITAPAAFAQIAVDTPVGGVRIGEQPHHFHSHYGYTARTYVDEPVVERRVYRERSVGLNCRTVTVERDDGSMKRIRRCD
jgi:hypothetical protein